MRLLNVISDIQVWPNRQAAEVHRRFQRARRVRTELRPRKGSDEPSAHLLLAAIQEKYRGVGLGTKMVSWGRETVKALGVETMFHVGNAREVEFMHQCGIQSIDMNGFTHGDSVAVS